MADHVKTGCLLQGPFHVVEVKFGRPKLLLLLRVVNVDDVKDGRDPIDVVVVDLNAEDLIYAGVSVVLSFLFFPGRALVFSARH